MSLKRTASVMAMNTLDVKDKDQDAQKENVNKKGKCKTQAQTLEGTFTLYCLKLIARTPAFTKEGSMHRPLLWNYREYFTKVPTAHEIVKAYQTNAAVAKKKEQVMQDAFVLQRMFIAAENLTQQLTVGYTTTAEKTGQRPFPRVKRSNEDLSTGSVQEEQDKMQTNPAQEYPNVKAEIARLDGDCNTEFIAIRSTEARPCGCHMARLEYSKESNHWDDTRYCHVFDYCVEHTV